MRIEKIEIANFRAIKSAEIDCRRHNVFVGPNGVGKSTVLQALNLFFGELGNISDDDFWNRNTTAPITVTCVFDSLSEQAKTDFKHYVRNGKLRITVNVAKGENGDFKRTTIGERLVFAPFQPFFELPATPAKLRADLYKTLSFKFPSLPNATSAADRENALRDHEENLPETAKVVVPSGDQFFGSSQGRGYLKMHVQWVYIPAVKDAANESVEGKSSHLGKLIQYTVKAAMDYENALSKIKTEAADNYQKLLDSQRHHLETLQTRLSDRLKTSVTSDADLALAWKQDDSSVKIDDPTAQVKLSDHGFSGDVAQFGHGLQRTFLITILQELLDLAPGEQPTLILGCEEPELYQHPPQAKHLAEVLTGLSHGEAQVFLTSHSPYFVDAVEIEGVNKVSSVEGEAKFCRTSFDQVLADYNKYFPAELRNASQARARFGVQIQPKFNELFFSEKAVLVEGISDQACFESYLRLSGRLQDFRKKGAAIIVCEGKSYLTLLLLIAKSFQIPAYAVFDCDDSIDGEKRDLHKQDNLCVFDIAGVHMPSGFPPEHVIGPTLTAWVDNIDEVLATQLGEHRVACEEAGRIVVGHLKGSKKNPFQISGSMAHAWELGVTFPVFEEVINQILE